MQSVGVGIRQIQILPYLSSLKSSLSGSMPKATEISCTSWDASIWPDSTSQVLRIFPPKRHDRLMLPVAGLFGAAAGRVPLHQEKFGTGQVLAAAIGKLARQGRPLGNFLAHYFFAGAQAALGIGDTENSANASASAVCSFSHKLKASLTTPVTKAEH